MLRRSSSNSLAIKQAKTTLASISCAAILTSAEDWHTLVSRMSVQPLRYKKFPACFFYTFHNSNNNNVDYNNNNTLLTYRIRLGLAHCYFTAIMPSSKHSSIQIKWNLLFVLERRGKPECLEKYFSGQSRQTTNSTHTWPNNGSEALATMFWKAIAPDLLVIPKW